MRIRTSQVLFSKLNCTYTHSFIYIDSFTRLVVFFFICIHFLLILHDVFAELSLMKKTFNLNHAVDEKNTSMYKSMFVNINYIDCVVNRKTKQTMSMSARNRATGAFTQSELR